MAKKKKHRSFVKKKRQYKKVIRRFRVLSITVMFAVPGIISVFVYDLKPPTYEAEQRIAESLFLDEESIKKETDSFEDYPEFFQCFQNEVWQAYSIQERITVLQELTDFEAEKLAIPTVPIATGNLSMYTLGQYDWGTHKIYIDVKYLAKSAPEECITTVTHEIWHFLQAYLIENIDWDSEVVQSAYFEELRSWKDNSENYRDAYVYGYDAYSNQPLEESARSYADKETAIILKYVKE